MSLLRRCQTLQLGPQHPKPPMQACSIEAYMRLQSAWLEAGLKRLQMAHALPLRNAHPLPSLQAEHEARQLHTCSAS
jgi:hypothetical protein